MLLEEILSLYDSPLSQEQTWGICYMLTKSISTLRSREFASRKAVRISVSLNSVDLYDDGDIEVLEIELSSRTQQSERDIISSIGDVLCRCLNHGLGELDIDAFNLQDDMAELIGRMVLLPFDDSDEGFNDDGLATSWSSVSSSLHQQKCFQSLEDIVYFCEARIARNDIKGGLKHYRNVTKALYAEAVELRTFLRHVLKHDDRPNQLDDASSDNEGHLKQWAKLWLSVMNEIRMISSLEQQEQKPERYALMPTEIIAQKVKAESEAILRKEKEFLNLPENGRELVLNFLITKLGPLTGKDTENYDVKRKLIFTDKGDQPSARLIQQRNIDKKSDSLHSSKSSGSKIKSSSFMKGSRSNFGHCKIAPDSMDSKEIPSSPKKKLHVPTPLKFENWVKPGGTEEVAVSNYNSKTISNDDLLFTDSMADVGSVPSEKSEFHHVLNEKPNEYTGPVKIKKRLSVSAMCLTEIDIEEGLPSGKLGASFLEICKTRQEITRAETEILADSTLKAKEIKYGKVCFGCKKKKFGLLNKHQVCQVCRKKYCNDCSVRNFEIAEHLIHFDTPHTNLTKLRPMSLSVGDLSSQSSITPFPCRGQSIYGIGKRKTSAGPLMTLCKECKCFVDSIMTETRNCRWQVRMQMDL